MPTPIFTGSVKDGRLNLDNRARFDMFLPCLEGRRVQVVVKKLVQNRSNNQNRAYWGIVVEMLSEHLGYSRDEIHEALKVKFASRVDPDTGLIITESTADMDTVRFNKYYEDIQRWAAEFLGLNIPSPNEYE